MQRHEFHDQHLRPSASRPDLAAERGFGPLPRITPRVNAGRTAQDLDEGVDFFQAEGERARLALEGRVA